MGHTFFIRFIVFISNLFGWRTPLGPIPKHFDRETSNFMIADANPAIWILLSVEQIEFLHGMRRPLSGKEMSKTANAVYPRIVK
jgi:hypothetical protein